MRISPVLLLVAALAGCGRSEHRSGIEATPTPTDTPTPTPTPSGATVGDYVTTTCTTSVLYPLSVQLIQELNCLAPGAVAQMPADSQIDATGIFDYLQTPAGSTLPAVADERPGVTLHVNSALRSLAQQYLLYEWYLAGRCSISLAATPGTSNHERGLAVDVQDNAGWRNGFEAHAWSWLGASDPVHYDFDGGGTVNIQGTSVRAFQRLWNLNHPGDPLVEDGDYGPQTAARVRNSPAAGFAIGSDCGPTSFTFAEMIFQLPSDLPDTCGL